MRHLLGGHDCTNVQRRGWQGVKNGVLLSLAAEEFDLFITSDQSMRYQQNLAGSTIAVLRTFDERSSAHSRSRTYDSG